MSDGDGAPKTILGLKAPVKPTSKNTFHFLAGLTSGLTSSILLQPADLLKTRVQQSSSSSLLPTLKAILAGPSPILSLWRGTLPSALRTGFGSALYFTTLNAMRTSVARSSATIAGAVPIIEPSSSALPKLTPLANLTTGAFARTFAGLVMMPVTVLKVRYESSLYAYKSLYGASRDILRTEGPRGFFAGFGATAVRDAPYAGLYVVIYEAAKGRIGGLLNTSSSETDTGADGQAATIYKSATATNFLSGMFAAGLATALTNPFDAVKTRLQLQPFRYKNMISAVRLMLREEGVRSLFDGLTLRMGRKALSSALAWTVYEDMIARAERRWEDKAAAAAGEARL